MKQGGLNNCQLMHCRKPITDTLDAVKIACANEQRKAHFGKFKKEYVNGRVKNEPPPPHVSKRSAACAIGFFGFIKRSESVKKVSVCQTRPHSKSQFRR